MTMPACRELGEDPADDTGKCLKARTVLLYLLNWCNSTNTDGRGRCAGYASYEPLHLPYAASV